MIRVLFDLDEVERSGFRPMCDSLLIEPPEDAEVSRAVKTNRVVETSPAVGWVGIMLFLGLLWMILRWLLEKVS